MNNRDRLIEIIIDRNLERREIAVQLGVDRETVDQWLVPTESARLSPMPDMAIELLEIKLGMRQLDLYIPEAER